MRRLNHPNLLKIYEVYESNGSIYFILDIIEGGELIDRVLDKGTLNDEKL